MSALRYIGRQQWFLLIQPCVCWIMHEVSCLGAYIWRARRSMNASPTDECNRSTDRHLAALSPLGLRAHLCRSQHHNIHHNKVSLPMGNQHVLEYRTKKPHASSHSRSADRFTLIINDYTHYSSKPINHSICGYHILHTDRCLLPSFFHSYRKRAGWLFVSGRGLCPPDTFSVAPKSSSATRNCHS